MRLTVRPDNEIEVAALERKLVPVPWFEGYFGFMAARALMAGCSLGVFTSLDAHPETPAALAARLGLSVDGAQTLLQVLEAMEYVESDSSGKYRPSAITKKWLLADSELSLNYAVGGFGRYVWESWSSLENDLQLNQPSESVADRHERDPDDPFWYTYLRSVYEQARQRAPGIAEAINLEQPKKMLDIAGGHGALSNALCDRYPELQATVVDLEGSVRAGKRLARENGYGERITWQSGDVFTSDLGSDYDLVLISAFIHYLAPAKAVELLTKVSRALRPGGTVVISDAPFHADSSPDQFDALVALDYVVSSGHRPHYVSEVIDFLKQAGFSNVHQHPEVSWVMLVFGTAS